MNNSIFQTLK